MAGNSEYYKIKESFRDVLGRVHTRVLLTPRYLPDLTPEEIVQIRADMVFPNSWHSICILSYKHQ